MRQEDRRTAMEVQRPRSRSSALGLDWLTSLRGREEALPIHLVTILSGDNGPEFVGKFYNVGL